MGCPMISPYELNNQTELVMFGNTYLIQEKNRIDPILQIDCSNDQFVYIFSAFYGLYFNTDLNDEDQGCPDVCYSRKYFENAKARCQSKQTCQIVYNEIDPCEGCLKIENVKYLCANSSTIAILNQCEKFQALPQKSCPESNDPNINDQTWLYGYQSVGAKVNCTGLQSIEIKCAFYGYDTLNSKINPNVQYGNITAYYQSSTAFKIVGNKCNNLTECIIDSGIQFSDSGEQNSILQIQWSC